MRSRRVEPDAIIPNPIVSPFQGLELLETVDPGRRSRPCFALGYRLLGFQPCYTRLSRSETCQKDHALYSSLFILATQSGCGGVMVVPGGTFHATIPANQLI